AQLVADELGVDINDVTVIHGDTSIVQYGIGTFGSRGTAVGGTAVFNAIQKLKEKAALLAAHLLQTEAASVSFKEGRFSAEAAMAASGGNGSGSKEAGDPPSVSIQEVALAAHVAHNIPAGFEPGLSATNFFEPANFTFPFGTHIVQVEIDRET